MTGGFINFAGGSVAIEIGGTAAGQFGNRIERTDDLKAGKWTVLTQEAIAGTVQMIKVIDAGAGTQKQCFYRVVETYAAGMKKP